MPRFRTGSHHSSSMTLVHAIVSPTKEEVNAFARVCLSVCLSKITQKRVHGFG